MNARVRVLHLLGVSDDKQIRVTRLSGDQARMGFQSMGNVEIRSLVDDDTFDVASLLVGEVESEALRLDGFAVVLNAVCDPDTNLGALSVASKIVDALGVPVFNDPSKVAGLTRDAVAEALDGVDGLVVPRTTRIQPSRVRDVVSMATAAGLALPILVREAGTHGGHKLALIRGEEDNDLLEQFAFDGRWFYATEFVDTRSPDGLHRKYRVLVVDGEPVAKHLIASQAWNVHARDRASVVDHPDLRAEDDVFVSGLPAAMEPVFRAMDERLDLDYFGADFGLDEDGAVVLFEANACVRALAGSATESEIPSHHAATERIRSLVRGRLLTLAGRH
ncbi:ATP-grasp domain-containing protein [Actinospongicola halichondriae]|uniref:ATP-grasp domain-containing protein n=1 Tax=Actinospongicola halichondriae TaxID=3236844 RepID=UPI003D4D3559